MSNFLEMNNSLENIINININERIKEYKENKNNKREVIGKTFGLENYEKNEFIFIPKNYEKEIFNNKYDKYYYQNTTCNLIIKLLELK